MYFLSGLLAIVISAYSYMLGVDSFALETISITIVIAQLCFVLFAYLAIVFLLKSLEKERIWPWNWGVKKLWATYGKSDERRRGVDRRVKQEVRMPKNERRSGDRRFLHIA